MAEIMKDVIYLTFENIYVIVSMVVILVIVTTILIMRFILKRKYYRGIYECIDYFIRNSMIRHFIIRKIMPHLQNMRLYSPSARSIEIHGFLGLEGKYTWRNISIGSMKFRLSWKGCRYSCLMTIILHIVNS